MDRIMVLICAFVSLFDSITQSDILALLVLVIIGLIIIILIRLFIMLIPAVFLALVVWFLTDSLFWAGIIFLVVVAISVLKKL